MIKDICQWILYKRMGWKKEAEREHIPEIIRVSGLSLVKISISGE